MKVIVLDYAAPCVKVLKVPDSLETVEQMESYLSFHGIKLSQVNYMSAPDGDIPVFDEESNVINYL